MNIKAKQVMGPALSAVIVAGAVIVAPGVLITAAAPAQADACSQFGFPNGPNAFDTGWGASLPFNAAGKSISQGATGWLGSIKGAGYLNGNVYGTGLSFTWKGDGGPPNFSGGDTITFSGTVDNDGSGHGTAMNTTTNKISTFTLQKRLVCLDAPVVAPPPPVQAPPAVQPPPAAATATVLQNDDIYNKPDGTGKAYKDADGINIFVPPGQVQLATNPARCDDWCHITTNLVPGDAWIYSAKDFVTKP